ncbi:hypothetical protein KY290_011593 [Solanum tuberosum]|uniref:Uncharacterized protein n=1 Tax=Solanum tuberosum TaxID=4113 RepID=A0ABQ7W166_SOLTU|nr:hypothetical protein KY290_011593 [Solanum tuberosum]
MFDPSNIVTASNANAIEGSDPNEWQYWDAFVNYNSMDDIIFQNSTSPSATLPNEHGSGGDTEGPDFNNSR